MKREEFLQSQQLQIKLISTQKKMMQLRTRYVIEVITDKRVEQVRKTLRQFEYFHKILQKKLGMKDKQLYLGKHVRSSSKYTDLQFFINRLNSGYLIYKKPREIQQRRNADLNATPQKSINSQLQLQPGKTRQLRNYLYDLLFREDELFVDGVDQESPLQQEVPELPNNISSIKAQFKKQQFHDDDKKSRSKDKEKKKKSQSEHHSPSRNPFKRLWQASNAEKALDRIGQFQPANKALDTIQRTELYAYDLKSAIIYDKSKPRQKSTQSGKLGRALKSIAFKAKNAGSKVMNASNLYENYTQTKNMKQILQKIEKCWIKFPNNYSTRDRNVIYKPYIWQPYYIRLLDNVLQFTNSTTLHRHRKIFVIFQCDVEINFNNYTKIIVKNKIDKNPLQIRLSLSQEPEQQITQQYLALYTYIKQIVKQEEQKLKMVSTLDMKNKVCNKVRIRINLKQKQQNSLPRSTSQSSQNQPFADQKGSRLYLNFPHIQQNQYKKQQFQFKALKQASSNVRTLGVRIIHSSIQAYVTLSMDTYVDVDFPILDNFGALDIIVDQIQRENGGFLTNIGSKDPLCTLHLPVQTIYDYMYNTMPERRKHMALTELKKKMIEIKHTKVNLSLDYKCIGNYYALCLYNQNDIFQDDQPPQQFNRDQFRMNNNRLKRIIWSIQLYTDKLKDLKNFTYPNLSYLFYIFLACACLFYDNNNYFLWVLIFLLSILFYNSPVYTMYIKDITDFLKLQAKKKNLDVFLFKKNKLIEQQYVFSMKKEAKKIFLQQFKLTRKVKRSIYKKYRRLLQVLLQAQIMITKFTSFIQKVKNLFIWYHYEKTKIVFFILAGMAGAILILPIRFILFVVILKQMKKGSKYHANVQDINRVIIIELIRIIIRQNNLVYMGEFFREHFRPLDLKNAQTHVFFKTCDDLISRWLQVKINMDEISKKSINMSQFVTKLSKCKEKYKILPEICQKYGFSLEWSKTQNSLKRLFDLIYGFIVTIPSDKYIMGVKTINNNEEEEMEEVQNIIDRELLNF